MDLPLNDVVEAEAVKTALATAFYAASDEERACRDVLHRLAPGSDEHRVTESGMVEAARRRMRYSLLHDRVLALIDAERVHHYQAEVVGFPTTNVRPLRTRDGTGE
jgi:hypothetical protein